MSLGINVFRNKRRRKKSRGNICHLGINIAQSEIQLDKFHSIIFKKNVLASLEKCFEKLVTYMKN